MITLKRPQVSYTRQELLTLSGQLSSPPVFWRVRVAHLFSFLCCPFSLDFPFLIAPSVFTNVYLQRGPLVF